MTLGMDHVIVVIKGDITDKKLLKKLRVDAIVNAANPTLMGSDQGMDGAIHAKLPKLKKRICKELGTDRLANRQRCGRGKAVTTSDGEKGKKLCRYIIHTVGSKYDGSGEICSSSRIQILENCYHSVIDEVKKHPDIRNVAVPVIGAGDYGFPFKLAMEIAVCSINNAILEWRQKDSELFEKAKLERVYIFIFHPSKAKTDEKFQTANWVMQKYHQLFMNYMEAALDLSVLYGCCERWFSWGHAGLISIRAAGKCGLLGFQNIPEHVSWAETLPWMSDIFLYADSAIKFFFFSLVLVYLASHMKQKEFLS